MYNADESNDRANKSDSRGKAAQPYDHHFSNRLALNRIQANCNNSCYLLNVAFIKCSIFKVKSFDKLSLFYFFNSFYLSIFLAKHFS